MPITFCPHGYGGFFKCPKGCHSNGPVADYEEIDNNIDYLFERQAAFDRRRQTYLWKPQDRIIIDESLRDNVLDIPSELAVKTPVKQMGGFFHDQAKRKRLREKRRRRTGRR